MIYNIIIPKQQLDLSYCIMRDCYFSNFRNEYYFAVNT
jgi:hypothetical protein